jgi:hypothetical protein
VRLFLLIPLIALAACASAKAPMRAEPSAGSGSAPGALEVGRSIVRTATVEVERPDPGQGPAQAAELAKTHGGYAQRVSAESATVRVPAERLEGFLGAVPALGQVEQQTVTAEDVTEAHQDLKVRLDNLTRARERYLELLQRAVTVEEAVKVERELERVTAEYESLKARLESLEGQVALATVHLEFRRPVRPGPVGWVFWGLGKAVKWLFIWD